MLVKDLRSVVLHQPMLREMEFFLMTERFYGTSLVKFITRSQTAATLLRRRLRKLQEEGKISFWVSGEDFHADNQTTQYLIDRFPKEQADEDFGKGNKDITIVCLYPR